MQCKNCRASGDAATWPRSKFTITKLSPWCPKCHEQLARPLSERMLTFPQAAERLGMDLAELALEITSRRLTPIRKRGTPPTIAAAQVEARVRQLQFSTQQYNRPPGQAVSGLARRARS